MNKLRLIKIYELRGLIHPIEQYIIEILDGIEKINWGHFIVYNKDRLIYFSYNLKTNDVYLNYDVITKNNEREEIIKYLLEKHLKITINRVY